MRKGINLLTTRMEMSETTDVQIGRLDERFKAFEKRFDDNSKVVLGELKDLKDGFAARLDRLEMGKFSSKDFVEWRNNEFVPVQATADDNKTFIENLKGKWAILAIVGMIVVAALTAVVSNFAVKAFQNKDITTTTNIICIQEKIVINCP